MDVAHLAEFLEGRREGRVMAADIHEEVEEHFRILTKKGSSSPIWVSGEASLVIANVHLQRLIKASEDGVLDARKTSYIADLICMYEGFETDEDAEDILNFLADI